MMVGNGRQEFINFHRLQSSRQLNLMMQNTMLVVINTLMAKQSGWMKIPVNMLKYKVIVTCML